MKLGSNMHEIGFRLGSNIIGTQTGSGPPFYLPARLATIENRLQKVETTQDHHTECFKVLFDHFKIPFPHAWVVQL